MVAVLSPDYFRRFSILFPHDYHESRLSKVDDSPAFEPLVTFSPFGLGGGIFDGCYVSQEIGGTEGINIRSSIYSFPHKVYLHPHPKFLTKVASRLHINQEIILLAFFSKTCS